METKELIDCLRTRAFKTPIDEMAADKIEQLQGETLDLHHAGCGESERATENQKEIERLRLLLDKMIFVVESDHAITYAGMDWAKARSGIRGGNSIAVWRHDKWLGDVDGDGRWIFTSVHSDSPDVTKQ